MQLFGKPLELLILDFDGVVLDLFATYQEMLETVARKFNLPPEPIQTYIEGHRNGTRKGNPRFKASIRSDFWPWLSPADAEDFYWAFRTVEERIGYPLVPGSIAAVRSMRRLGVKVAICTMNDNSAMTWKMRAAGITASLVDSIVTRERAGHEKPDPRIFGPVYSDTGIKHTGVLYVGDGYVDKELADKAGVAFIAVLSGGIPRHAFLREGVPEDHILERLADLPKLITE